MGPTATTNTTPGGDYHQFHHYHQQLVISVKRIQRHQYLCIGSYRTIADVIAVTQNRYEKEFENVQDVFELQRNLNNAFAYDLVPSPSVITAALKAARRVNDFPTAVRIFEGMSQIPGQWSSFGWG